MEQASTPLPIYVGIKLTDECAAKIEHYTHLMLGDKIPAECFVPQREYHITMLYAPDGTIDNVIPYNPYSIAFPNVSVGTAWALAHMNNGTIAVIIISKFLRKLHKQFYAVSKSRLRFSGFVPHVTIATDVPKIPYLQKFINIPIVLNFLYAEPLNK